MSFFNKTPCFLRAGFSLLVATGLTACGGKADADAEATAGQAKTKKAVEIDDKGWVPTDLSKTNPKLPIIISLPADTKLEKPSDAETSSLEFSIGENYQIAVRPEPAMTIAENIENEKNFTALYDTLTYLPGKIVKEDAQGFVYVKQQKPFDGGPKYAPEAHFVLFLKAPGKENIYSIRDSRPLSTLLDNSGSWPEANAIKLYELMKASAKVK